MFTNIQYSTSIFVMCVRFKYADFQRRQCLLQHLTLKQVPALSKLTFCSLKGEFLGSVCQKA